MPRKGQRTINPAWETMQGQLAQLDEMEAKVRLRAPMCGAKWERKMLAEYAQRRESINAAMPPKYLEDE